MRYEQSERPTLPEWMKVRLKMGTGATAGSVRTVVAEKKLVTVCEEASCPNLGHCWGQGTATFMVMGDRCTRRCGFCDVRTAKPLDLDPAEPRRVAEAIREMKLKHAVITSVDRDDLVDGGSAHFANVVIATRELNPDTTIEVLIPDFKGKQEDLDRIFQTRPEILNHNVETVPSLYRTICPQSNYKTSLSVLGRAAAAGLLAKSGIILGLGETIPEVEEVLRDLRSAGATLATIGQYLQPSVQHAPLKGFIPPEVFSELREYGMSLGFLHIESGPLVRSSYHAGDALDRILGQQGRGKLD